MRRSDGVGTGNVAGDGRRDGLPGAVAAVPGLSPHAWGMWGCCQPATPRVTLETPTEGQAAPPPSFPGCFFSRLACPTHPEMGANCSALVKSSDPAAWGSPRTEPPRTPGGRPRVGPAAATRPAPPQGLALIRSEQKAPAGPAALRGDAPTALASPPSGTRRTRERRHHCARRFPPHHPPCHTHPPGGPRPASPSPLTWVPGGGSSRSRRRRRR